MGNPGTLYPQLEDAWDFCTPEIRKRHELGVGGILY